MNHKKKFIRLGLINIFFIVICIISLIPILYAFSVSINAGNNVLSSNFSFFPKQLTLDNYKTILFEKPFFLWLKNSALLAFFTVIISVSVAVPAAYAFSRLKFKGRKPILYMLLVLNAFPSILSMFALYRLFKPLKLINTYAGLVLIYIGGITIFSLWNMKGYFDTIPQEIEEAGKIDGASDFQIMTKIVIPLAKPTIIVTAVLAVLSVWNDYIFALNFMTGSEKYTLAVGLYSLQATAYTRNWPLFSAAALLTTLPTMIIFFLIQKQMRSGLTAGSVKG